MAMDFNTDLLPSSNGTYYLGSASQKWKINGYTSPTIIETVAATSETSVTISNPDITSVHVVFNTIKDGGSDMTWTTANGSVTLSCASGIPSCTLFLTV